MTPQIERRSNAQDELSPDILALLESCGGEIRESDREVLARRRAAARGATPRRRSGDHDERPESGYWPVDLPGSGA